MKTTYRILIVDDEDNVRRMLATAFSLQGHETHCASDGKAALSLFSETQPDVVLMDIRMPEMDGLETARAIRALERTDAKRIPIVAMTANAFAEDVQAAIDAGMNAHIAKPFDVNKMVNVISGLVG